MTEAAGIYARESPRLDRCVQVGIASGRVVSVSFPDSLANETEPDHALLDRVFEYLDGVAEDFDDVECALTVPTDRRAVLEAVREVPYGSQVTVERLARRVPDLDEDDRDRVRTALGTNPIPLVIPDHRVRNAPSAAPSNVERRLRSLEGL
jgi:methylated-DNA-[protein]-cysteine S-methyltransferase